MSAPTDPAHHDTTVLGAVHPGSPGHPVPSRYPTTGVGAGSDPYTGPAPRAGEKTPRTIRVRMAAVIAVVAFVIGLGVSMLLGPIMGPGPGGPGGPGQNGTSQTGATTSQTGTQGTGN